MTKIQVKSKHAGNFSTPIYLRLAARIPWRYPLLALVPASCVQLPPSRVLLAGATLLRRQLLPPAILISTLSHSPVKPICWLSQPIFFETSHFLSPLCFLQFNFPLRAERNLEIFEASRNFYPTSCDLITWSKRDSTAVDIVKVASFAPFSSLSVARQSSKNSPSALGCSHFLLFRLYTPAPHAATVCKDELFFCLRS